MSYFQPINNSPENSHTVDQEELTVFMIPDITGDGRVLYQLADAFDEKRNHRSPLYVYNEPTIEGEVRQMSLKEHATAMVEEILAITKNSPLPYVIVGYSFGGILAAEVSRQLQELHKDPRLYVIDEPAESCVQKYIAANNHHYKLDLINITNYAAELSSMPALAHTEGDLDSLSHLTTEGAIEYLERRLLAEHNNANEVNASLFKTYMEVAKRNLCNMSTAEQNPAILKNTHVILTDEMQSKYGANHNDPSQKEWQGEWNHCSETVTALIDDELRKQSHMKLLTAENARTVAALISDSLKSELTEDYLYELQQQELNKRRNKKEEPENTDQTDEAPPSSKKAKSASPIQQFTIYNNPRSPSPSMTTADLAQDTSAKNTQASQSTGIVIRTH